MSAEAPTISVKLVDAPGDYDAVNVEIVDVMIKMDDDSDSESGWMSLNAEAGSVNLLDFTGGISKVLVDRFPIPAGTLSQMRLVLGDGNTIVIRNDADEPETFDLKTPSAQQSGLKLKVNTTIEEGFTYDFILDFNVEKSIVNAGNSGNIILKPVLNVSTEVSSGIIEGTIEPNDVPSMVSVLVDDMGTEDTSDDFVISANTDDTGAFALWGVPAGAYDVVATPLDSESDYAEGTAMGVTVVNGETTTIADPIQLTMKPGSISGDVTNDIVVSVTVKDKDSGDVVATMDSNETGEFLFEDIPTGTYIVTISATGFVSQDYTKDGSIDVVVTSNTETVLDPITLVAE
ncbi:hypothetical protein GCM10007962_05620 [Yeosuana aromativorans]|uniref:DUF4382 domain-containing protein n=2 Tax=Yeosuana aromativorans TaxID=288019 RepID=A0A8J3BIU6_9FLAO|nr:hypothetical protein GCM10007962_05620 [Yeosuana aromativorans]